MTLKKISSHFLGILRYFILLEASLHAMAVAHSHLCYFTFLFISRFSVTSMGEHARKQGVSLRKICGVGWGQERQLRI